MGLFGTLIGWDQNISSLNACLASHLIDNANNGLKKQIAQRIVDITFDHYCGTRTREALLENLNNLPRFVQMQFVAKACNNLGISPNIPGWHDAGFYRVGNPYRLEGRVTEDDIASSVSAIKKRYGFSIKWPGDDVKVDFLAWYDGEAGAKPKRGENLKATATVPLETAELGGSARVVLPTGRTFDVTIPAGVEEPTQIRLRGQGQPGPIGGEPGDALITIKIAT